MCRSCIAEQAETTKPGKAFGSDLYVVCVLVPELPSCCLPAHGWARDWTLLIDRMPLPPFSSSLLGSCFAVLG